MPADRNFHCKHVTDHRDCNEDTILIKIPWPHGLCIRFMNLKTTMCEIAELHTKNVISRIGRSILIGSLRHRVTRAVPPKKFSTSHSHNKIPFPLTPTNTLLSLHLTSSGFTSIHLVLRRNLTKIHADPRDQNIGCHCTP